MRKVAVTVLALFCLVGAAVPAAAGGAGTDPFPSEIDLPDIFPEGIAVGRGSTFFVGSLADGSIHKGDLRTGESAVLTAPTGVFTTIGLDVDRQNRVWAAGGLSGTGRVYDGATGELLATYVFTDPLQSTINDVIVTPEAAWFTDSGTGTAGDCPPYTFCGEPRVFKVALERGGALPDDPFAGEEIAVDVEDVAFSNLNGIETMPGNDELIVAHTSEGVLYRVNPGTGEAAVLYDETQLQRPDGMVRVGRTLYVSENQASRIAVIQIDPTTGTGTLQGTLLVDGAQTPSTVAVFGSAVYAVDARLGTPFVGPYKIFRVER